MTRTCDIHEDQPAPCRICEVKLRAIVGSAAREAIEARELREHGMIESAVLERNERMERRQGYTLAELAKLTGISGPRVWHLIERGETAATLLAGTYKIDRKQVTQEGPDLDAIAEQAGISRGRVHRLLARGVTASEIIAGSFTPLRRGRPKGFASRAVQA